MGSVVDKPELEISAEELAYFDAWYWAWWNKVRLQSGEFQLEGHEYLIEPMRSDALVKVFKKGAQLGFTEGEVLGTLWALTTGRYPQGVLYLFPTSDDVSDFSMARFNPLIQENYDAIGKFVNTTDRTNIKRIGSGILYLRGARATQKVEGLKRESSKLRSIPVDKVVFDEVDLMEEAMIQMALVRMSHSKIKKEVYIASPTIPDYGIEKRYNISDQRIWVIKCSRCNRDCCLELDFPNCVQYDKHGGAKRVCVRCGNELFPKDGQWVAREKSDIAGWWISQLNSIYVNPGEILRLYEHPPNGNPQEVYNSKLGMGYISTENRLTPNILYGYCGQDGLELRDSGPCAMGVDVGKLLHVVIGKRLSAKQRKIVWFGELKDFGELYHLIHQYNVTSCAIDYEPETRAAREFQSKAGCMVYLIDYKEKVKAGEKDDNRHGVTDVARTEICDAVHHAILGGHYVFPRRSALFDEYVGQMCNLAKILEEDEDKGTKVYRYRKLGPDHYRHATNYFEIAVKNTAMAVDGETFDELFMLMKKVENKYDPLTYGLGVA